MRNGHPEADPGAQNGLPLLDRPEYLLEGAAGVIHQMMRELGYDAGFIARRQGDENPVWRQNLSQKHRTARGDMGQSYTARQSEAMR